MKLYKNIIFVSLFLLPLLASCGGKGGSDSSSVEPEILVFKVSPDVADPQAIVTLSWDTNAESAEIPGIGMVPASGSREITADTSKVFTLIARVRDMVRTAQARLMVRPGLDPPPGPNPDPEPGPNPDPPPDPGPIPPPQDVCVENPGVMVAGGDNFFYNGGVENLRVFGENKVYFIKDKTTLDGTYSWLEFCERSTGESEFTCTVLGEYARNGGGGTQYAYTLGPDGSIYLVWWRVGATTAPFETKAYFVSRPTGSQAWSEPVELPYRNTVPYSLPKLVISGNNLYLFDQPDFDRSRILVNRSADRGATWSNQEVVYENLNASVQLTSAEPDASGKVYVSLFEHDTSVTPNKRYMSLLVSDNQGVSWKLTRTLLPDNEGPYDTEIDATGLIYQLYQIQTGALHLRTSPDFMIWTTLGEVPRDTLRSFNLYLAGNGYTILGLSPFCATVNGNTAQSVMAMQSPDGTQGSWTSPRRFQTLSIVNTSRDSISQTFSAAVTPSGNINVLWSKIMGGTGTSLLPSELYLMRDP